jgi:alanine racemase
MTDTYRCWVEIERGALRQNAALARERIGSAEMLAVVKANAYGHGMIGVAQALANEVQLFGVANLEEATALREAGLSHPIIILGPALPGERAAIVERMFIPTISALEEAEAFAAIGSVAINFKVDTGMGRMGVPEANSLSVFKQVSALPNIRLHSISTSSRASAKSSKNFARTCRAITRRTFCKARGRWPSTRIPTRSSVPASCFTASRRCRNSSACSNRR